MAIQFRVVPHSGIPGVPVGQILLDGEMIASIYPDGEKGIRIISAHMKEVRQDDGRTSVPPIPHVSISFDVQPYTTEGGRLVRHPQ